MIKSLILAVFLMPVYTVAQNLSINEVDSPPIIKGFCEGDPSEECFSISISQFMNSNVNIADIIKSKESGKAYIQFTVSEKGEVINVRSRSKFATIARVAEDAIKELTIAEPAMLNDQPVAITYTLPFKFRSLEIGNDSARISGEGDFANISDVKEVATPPEFQGYETGIRNIVDRYKYDLGMKLRQMNYTDKQIDLLKISLIVAANGEISRKMVIHPDRKLQNIVKAEVDKIVIKEPAKNKKGENEKVIISYDFSS
ncbi:energy transducer TonB [Christiangramia portivictoriae]|uniref:energy transducer TonB n=1 Tax=Christiangramia portivictoriae TaxID=326069 RepID=UPI0003FFE0B3|nr:energy transducer TonB [Christiangramia portivictoriae]